MIQKSLLLLLVFSLAIPNAFCMNSNPQHNSTAPALTHNKDNNTAEENKLPTIVQSWQKLITLDWQSLSGNDVYNIGKSITLLSVACGIIYYLKKPNIHQQAAPILRDDVTPLGLPTRQINQDRVPIVNNPPYQISVHYIVEPSAPPFEEEIANYPAITGQHTAVMQPVQETAKKIYPAQVQAKPNSVDKTDECLVCNEEAGDIVSNTTYTIRLTDCCNQLLCTKCIGDLAINNLKQCPNCRREQEFKTRTATIQIGSIQPQTPPVTPLTSSPSAISQPSSSINPNQPQAYLHSCEYQHSDTIDFIIRFRQKQIRATGHETYLHNFLRILESNARFARSKLRLREQRIEGDWPDKQLRFIIRKKYFNNPSAINTELQTILNEINNTRIAFAIN